MLSRKLFISLILFFLYYPLKTHSTFFLPPSGGCSCPQQIQCPKNCQLPAQNSYCNDYCQANFYNNCPPPQQCPPCGGPQNCECPISNCPQERCECNCPQPRECGPPPPKAEYCASYCPKVQASGLSGGEQQIVYPAGSVGAQVQIPASGGPENAGYVSGVVPGTVEGGAPGEYVDPAFNKPPDLIQVVPPATADGQEGGMSFKFNMQKSTGSGGSYSDKALTEDSEFAIVEPKITITPSETTTTTLPTTTIEVYDEIVSTSNDLLEDLLELNNETSPLPTFKYTLPPTVTDEVGATEETIVPIVPKEEIPNSSNLNLLPVEGFDRSENSVVMSNTTDPTFVKVYQPDPLDLDYFDNDLNSFNLTLKHKRLAGVKNVINKGPKCSHELLRKLMRENMVASPMISKQMIFSAGRELFKRSIDVVCSKNRFSYTVFSSKLFCEVTKKPVTCFAFIQPEPKEE